MKEKTPDEKILKEITSGKHRDYYLQYSRKSMDEAESQKNSLSYQKTENTRFANREKLPFAPITLTGFCTNGMISEKHSAFKEGDELDISDDGFVRYHIERPKFQKLLQHLSRGYFKGVVCLCWDRISRNEGEDTIVRKLMRKGIDVRFAFATYDDSSSGELHMDIDGMFSRHHSRVTSEKVTTALKLCRAEGKVTYRAPIGYLNPGSMNHKPFDPERAPIIKEMFELYDTGDWSMSELEGYANEQGLTTAPMRRRRTREEILADEDEDVEIEKVSRPVTKSHISRILTNLFYTGRTPNEDGVHIKSTSHEALVSDELFNRVQARLGEKNVSIRYTEKLDHPMRGMVRCAHCERVYTPYKKKGILYFNARCKKGCTNTKRNCNFNFISYKIQELISNLHFPDDDWEKFHAKASTDIALLEEKRHKEFEKMNRQKQKIRDDLSYLRSDRLSLLKTGVYTPETYVAEEQRLTSKLDTLKESEHISDVAMRELMKELATLSELLKSAGTLFELANPHKKEQIAKTIFSELYITESTLEYRVKKGFEAFEACVSSTCCPIAWLSELFESRQHIRSNIETFGELIKT